MQENTERWRQLCEQAAVEQDTAKLLELIREINRLLSEKKSRLNVTTMEPSEAHQH